jgi:transportin-1
MENYCTPLLGKLVPLLLDPGAARSLKENSAITIGRLGYACPHILAPHLETFIQKWFALLVLFLGLQV